MTFPLLKSAGRSDLLKRLQYGMAQSWRITFATAYQLLVTLAIMVTSFGASEEAQHEFRPMVRLCRVALAKGTRKMEAVKII